MRTYGLLATMFLDYCWLCSLYSHDEWALAVCAMDDLAPRVAATNATPGALAHQPLRAI